MRALLAALPCPKGDVAGNLAAHLRLLTGAAAAGCDLAVFPEMSLTGSVDPAAHPERLITLGHPAVAALARESGETGVGACFGLAERSRDGEPRITQVFAAGGRLIGAQRKRHLGDGEEAFTAARPAPRRMRTSPAWRRWSGRTAAWPPASPTGGRGCSALTSRASCGGGAGMIAGRPGLARPCRRWD